MQNNGFRFLVQFWSELKHFMLLYSGFWCDEETKLHSEKNAFFRKIQNAWCDDCLVYLACRKIKNKGQQINVGLLLSKSSCKFQLTSIHASKLKFKNASGHHRTEKVNFCIFILWAIVLGFYYLDWGVHLWNFNMYLI